MIHLEKAWKIWGTSEDEKKSTSVLLHQDILLDLWCEKEILSGCNPWPQQEIQEAKPLLCWTQSDQGPGARTHFQSFSTSLRVRKGQPNTVLPLQETVWIYYLHMRWKVDDEKDEKAGITTLATQWNFPFPITPATGTSTAATQHTQCLQCMCQI